VSKVEDRLADILEEWSFQGKIDKDVSYLLKLVDHYRGALKKSYHSGNMSGNFNRTAREALEFDPDEGEK